MYRRATLKYKETLSEEDWFSYTMQMIPVIMVLAVLSSVVSAFKK